MLPEYYLRFVLNRLYFSASILHSVHYLYPRDLPDLPEARGLLILALLHWRYSFKQYILVLGLIRDTFVLSRISLDFLY